MSVTKRKVIRKTTTTQYAAGESFTMMDSIRATPIERVTTVKVKGKEPTVTKKIVALAYSKGDAGTLVRAFNERDKKRA